MIEQEADPAGLGELADADLVLRTRSGDSAAFGELWRRHYRSGMTVARSITSSLDPDDLVQEAYARIFQSIVKGGGPTGSFRAYLFTSIRNTAAAWGRARRESTIDELESVEDPTTNEQATAEALDRSITAQAFRSLPTRWQEVLWYSEIERMKPAEIAPLLGMKATAVAQLTFRAREGLREAWIQAHLRSVDDGSDCQWTIERLGAYARGNLGPRDRGKVDKHLAECARCAIVAAEAREVSNRLALVLLPLTVGVAGTAGYLASLQGGGAPLVALAAMPSAVMEGAVTVMPGDGGASLAGVAAGGGGSSTTAGSSSTSGGGASAGAGGAAGGAGGAAAAGAAGGILSGAGTMVGLIAAGVVLVGAVVAGVIVLPALNAPATRTEANGVGPKDAAAQTDAEAQALSPSPSDLPALPPADDSTPPAADAPPPVTPDAANPGTTRPDVSLPGAGDPTAPQQPANPTDPTGPTGPTNPTDPTNPTNPTNPTDPTDPTPSLPEGSPTTGASSWELQGTALNIHVTLAGAPGSTAEVLLDRAVKARVTFDATGTAVVTLRPTVLEFLLDAPVGVRYVAGAETGDESRVRLSALVDRAAVIAAWLDAVGG